MSKTITNVVLYDLHSEIPATQTHGQLIICKEHNALHMWGQAVLEEPSNVGGGGAHPDLATHLGLGLEEAGSYALSGHTHPGGSSEAFPVGSVFISVVATNPATLLGYGTWTAFATGRMLVGIDAGQAEFDTVEGTGGVKTVTLTVNEMPAHTHNQQRHATATGALTGITTAPDTSSSNPQAAGPATASAGGGAAHTNLPPYIVTYMWKRTA